MEAHDEKELGKALKEKEDTIEITGDLAKKVIKIKATGKVAWVIAIGAIGVAVLLALSAPATLGTGAVAGVAALGPAVAILGTGTAVAAVSIAVAAGGVSSLSTLRQYNLEKISDDHVILRKK
jgi:hypothetical protein